MTRKRCNTCGKMPDERAGRVYGWVCRECGMPKTFGDTLCLGIALGIFSGIALVISWIVTK